MKKENRLIKAMADFFKKVGNRIDDFKDKKTGKIDWKMAIATGLLVVMPLTATSCVSTQQGWEMESNIAGIESLEPETQGNVQAGNNQVPTVGDIDEETTANNVAGVPSVTEDTTADTSVDVTTDSTTQTPSATTDSSTTTNSSTSVNIKPMTETEFAQFAEDVIIKNLFGKITQKNAPKFVCLDLSSVGVSKDGKTISYDIYFESSTSNGAYFKFSIKEEIADLAFSAEARRIVADNTLSTYIADIYGVVAESRNKANGPTNYKKYAVDQATIDEIEANNDALINPQPVVTP